MPSFDEAEKMFHYQAAGKRWRKVHYEESQQYPDAKQFTYNDGKSLGWFVPLDAKPAAPKQETK
jgi:hypothetical protein